MQKKIYIKHLMVLIVCLTFHSGVHQLCNFCSDELHQSCNVCISLKMGTSSPVSPLAKPGPYARFSSGAPKPHPPPNLDFHKYKKMTFNIVITFEIMSTFHVMYRITPGSAGASVVCIPGKFIVFQFNILIQLLRCREGSKQNS